MNYSWRELVFYLFSNIGNKVKSNIDGGNFDADKSVLNKLKEKQIDSLYYFLFEPFNSQQAIYDWVWKIQTECLHIVLNALNQEKIPYLIFKGAEFIGRYYNQRPINLLYDIDILVPRDKIMKVQSIMHSLGYHYGSLHPESLEYQFRDIDEVGRIMQYHYELPSLSKAIETTLPDNFSTFLGSSPTFSLWRNQYKTIVFAEFDFHYQLALDVKGDEVFERKVPSIYPGAYTLNPADALWYCLSKYYNEVAIHGKSNLRDFAYVIPLLDNENIEWDIFLCAVKEYKLYASTYYFLSFCNQFLTRRVPQSILSEIDPLKNTRLKDWGWQIEKLFEERIECPFRNPYKK